MMNWKKKFPFCCFVFLKFQLLYSQELEKVALTKDEIKEGLLFKYESGSHETYELLKLFKNKKFVYKKTRTEYYKFSNGDWQLKNGELVINSKIDSGRVPAKILYDEPLDTIRWRNLTNVPVPVNLKGKRFADSKVYVNDSLTYYFPFFDTCIGSYRRIDSIKVDFGSGFKSQWLKVTRKEFKQLKIVVDDDIDLYDYLSFINRRYKISGTSLRLVE